MIDRPVGDVLKGKGTRDLVVVDGALTVYEAVGQMNQKGLGSVVIQGKDGTVAGIFTERDLMRRVVGEGRDPKATALSAVMTPNVRRMAATEPVSEVLRVMVEHGYRHMVIDENGRSVGLVSIRDLMRWLILPDQPVAHEGRRGVIKTKAEDTVATIRQG